MRSSWHSICEHRSPGHRCRQRLCAAHTAEPCGQDPAPGEIAFVVLATHLDEGLVRALDDALAANIDPGTGRHLPEHHEAFPVELAKMLPVCPGGHQVRVGNQHARRIGVRAKDTHGLARLHEQRLVVAELLERRHDCVEALPVACRLADTAINDEILRPFGDFGVEVVHEHPERCFREPASGVETRARRRLDGPGHCLSFSNCTTSADVDRGVPGGV